MACNDFPNDPFEGQIYDTGADEKFQWVGGKWVPYADAPLHNSLEDRDLNDNHPEFSGAGTTFFVPDPVTSSGKFLKDDGTWDDPLVVNVDETVIDVDPGLDEIWTDVNLMDFSASPYASGTSLNVQANYVVSFANGTGVLWRYIGFRPVLLGIGGNYTALEEDFVPVGLADHDQLINVGPDDHHNQVHLLYGTDHDDINSVPTVENTHGLFWDGTKWSVNYRNRFIAGYAEGATYYPQEWVNNSSWLSVANKETTEPAFPVNVGEIRTIYGDAPPFLESNFVGQVRSGYLATFKQSGEITALSCWIPEVTLDTHFTLVVIQDPNGSASLTRYPLRNENLNANAWNIVAVGNALVTIGTEILVYLESHNYGGSTTVTGGWRYDGQANSANPATSGWNTNIAQNLLRIDKTDLDIADRSTELLGIVTGSTIQFAETATPSNATTYLTLGPPTDGGAFVSYPVSLTSETGKIDPTDVTTMTANVPIAQTTKFVYEETKFTPQPEAADFTSFLQYDDVSQAVPSDIGYGINFNFQQLSQSADWDLVSIGGGGGGGGDFTPETFLGAGTTGYVPDPVTADGKYLMDDGIWTNTIDGGTF